MADAPSRKLPSFADPAVYADPFATYERALEEHPVFHDEELGIYVISRYDDVRRVLMDTDIFRTGNKFESARKTVASEARTAKVMARFRDEGWLLQPNVGNLDAPRHTEIRRIFDNAFRPARVREMEGDIAAVACGFVDALPDADFDVVRAFAIPFPITVVCEQVGASRDDIWLIKDWMDALISRVGWMLSEEEELRAVDKIIASQHYFKAVIDRLRGNNDGTVLGDLVNAPLSDGSLMSDAEVMANIMEGIFLAGSETTSNSISAGIKILCERPALFSALKTGAEPQLRAFIEELLRLESPAQGVYRVTSRDTELEGVRIPKGAVVHLRVGASNRDPRKFECPAALDLERRNAGAHLAFGSGVHHCVGAALARRELHWAFRTLLDRFSGVSLSPRQGEVEYLKNYTFRSIKALNVRFGR